MAQKIRIDIARHHAASGKTVYRVAKDTRLNARSVAKYAREVVIADMMPAYIKDLADYYGVSMADVIQFIEVEEEDEETGCVSPVPAAN